MNMNVEYHGGQSLWCGAQKPWVDKESHSWEQQVNKNLVHVEYRGGQSLVGRRKQADDLCQITDLPTGFDRSLQYNYKQPGL